MQTILGLAQIHEDFSIRIRVSTIIVGRKFTLQLKEPRAALEMRRLRKVLRYEMSENGDGG